LSNSSGEALTIEELDILFNINKTLLGFPARGRIDIFNLSENNIQKITKKYTDVELFAGYEGKVALIFRGNVMNFAKNHVGPTSVFTLIVKSSTAAWEGSTFTKTYRAGTTPATIINEVVRSFGGVIPGQVLTSPDWVPSLADVTYTGSSRRVMDQLARDYNFDWNIVEGEVIVTPRNQALLDKPPYVVTPTTGLIGSPVLTEQGVDFRLLLNPAILLGRQIEMRSEFAELGQSNLEFRKVRNTADGIYKVMDIRLVGGTRTLDWYTDVISWGTTNDTRN
jgi:hypothetical protein